MEKQGSACDNGVCLPGANSSNPSPVPIPAAQSPPNPPPSAPALALEIEIISDTMCPWCWVGKRSLEKALTLRRESSAITADVTWLPFFLDKDLPDDGKPVREYYLGHYGDADVGDRMKPQLVAAGRRCGIDFEGFCEKTTTFRPTIRSHRLVEFAKRQGKQDDMVEALFRLYYEECGHLNSVEHLCAAAGRVGLEGNVRAYLESDEDEEAVFRVAREVKHLASGVPTFLISRKDRPDAKAVSLNGARPPEAFLRVFDLLASS